MTVTDWVGLPSTVSWTTIGNVGSPHRATVDRRGLLTPWPGGWSLDWWVGAEDRWHLPAVEAAVRQRLVADAPVVETAMRVPGGDILHRAYAVTTAPSDGGVEMVVVQIENATPVPVALALAVRPYNPRGRARIERIALVGQTTVTVDGAVSLVLPRPANRAAGSTARDGDVATPVLAGEAGPDFPQSLRCEAGSASAAFVYPLPHRATLTFQVPLAPPARPRFRGLGRRTASPAPVSPSSVPTADQVANGWKAHAGRGVRLVLPDTRLTAAVEANRRFLPLLLHGSQRRSSRGGALVLGALDRYGYRDDVAGALGEDLDHLALHAIAEHWRLHRDVSFLEGAAPAIAAAAEQLARDRSTSEDGAGEEGLWRLRGLLDAAEVLDALAEPGGAADARAHAARCRSEVKAGIEAGTIDALTACWPLRLLSADDHLVTATVTAMRDGLGEGQACIDAATGEPGFSPFRTLQLAHVELELGDRRALERLDWLLGVATATWTWSTSIPSGPEGERAGEGHDGVVAAAMLDVVRDLLVRETSDGGLALCSLVPHDWLGQPVEVHDAPTHHGLVSFAIRWHGDRPALLWELAPHDGTTAVRITAPGLDPSWSTTELRGDALLAAVPAPPGFTAEPQPDVAATPVRLSPRRTT